MTKAKKPPTQTAGVEGIAPKPIELTPARPVEQEQQVDWAKLCELPPFQMFSVELEPNLNGAGEDAIAAWISSNGPEKLYKLYCAWHAAKGYWPNETPTGELI